MKMICFLLVLCGLAPFFQNGTLTKIRQLYQTAAVAKTDARALQKLMLKVDSGSVPVLYCYKGANEMIQAKYSFNPLVKLENFNRGKSWINAAISRDTTDLEMRFIRYSIQNNLPVFLGYREDLIRDKSYLMGHIRECNDMELQKMIVNYLTVYGNLKAAEMKGLNN